jgi:hypothetical protein
VTNAGLAQVAKATELALQAARDTGSAYASMSGMYSSAGNQAFKMGGFGAGMGGGFGGSGGGGGMNSPFGGGGGEGGSWGGDDSGFQGGYEGGGGSDDGTFYGNVE